MKSFLSFFSSPFDSSDKAELKRFIESGSSLAEVRLHGGCTHRQVLKGVKALVKLSTTRPLDLKLYRNTLFNSDNTPEEIRDLIVDSMVGTYICIPSNFVDKLEASKASGNNQYAVFKGLRISVIPTYHLTRSPLEECVHELQSILVKAQPVEDVSITCGDCGSTHVDTSDGECRDCWHINDLPEQPAVDQVSGNALDLYSQIVKLEKEMKQPLLPRSKAA
tara:strand:- start:4858 stop:5520 length:663 start_codon:yes stop_codon:yes gene_type:complete